MGLCVPLIVNSVLFIGRCWLELYVLLVSTVFSLLHARASNSSAWAAYPMLNRNRREIGTGICSWSIIMYWSLLSCSNQLTAKINTRISAVVTCEAFLLYSVVGNIVVSSSSTIHAMQKLSQAVNITDPVRIVCGITLKCFVAASFQVFAATATI